MSTFFFIDCTQTVRKNSFSTSVMSSGVHSDVWNFCYEGGGGLKIPTIGNLLTSALANLEKYMSWTNSSSNRRAGSRGLLDDDG